MSYSFCRLVESASYVESVGVKYENNRVRVGATANPATTGLVVQSWKYNPEAKDLTLTVVNLSGKDIIAYNISISDGSTDYFG
jgi:hypothetical protein